MPAGPYQSRRGERSDPRSRYVPDADRASRRQCREGKTAGRAQHLVDHQRGQAVTAPGRWFTTSSRSVAGCAEATGNWSGGLRSRPLWSFTISRMTRPRKPTLPTRTRKSCRVAETDRRTGPGKRQIAIPAGCIQGGYRHGPRRTRAPQRGWIFHAGRLRQFGFETGRGIGRELAGAYSGFAPKYNELISGRQHCLKDGWRIVLCSTRVRMDRVGDILGTWLLCVHWRYSHGSAIRVLVSLN